MNTTSLRCGHVARDVRPAAPAASSGSALLRVRLHTVAAKPRAEQCPHMLDPITPVPIQPIRVTPGTMVCVVITLILCRYDHLNLSP